MMLLPVIPEDDEIMSTLWWQPAKVTESRQDDDDLDDYRDYGEHDHEKEGCCCHRCSDHGDDDAVNDWTQQQQHHMFMFNRFDANHHYSKPAATASPTNGVGGGDRTAKKQRSVDGARTSVENEKDVDEEKRDGAPNIILACETNNNNIVGGMATTLSSTMTEPYHDHLNRSRMELGLHPLRRSSDLDRLATKHAFKMATQGYLAHSVSNITSLKRLLRSTRVGSNIQRMTPTDVLLMGWKPTGGGNSYFTTPADQYWTDDHGNAMQSTSSSSSWKRSGSSTSSSSLLVDTSTSLGTATLHAMHDQSMTYHPGNRDNILSSRFNEYGIGLAQNNDDGVLYCCQYFRKAK